MQETISAVIILERKRHTRVEVLTEEIFNVTVDDILLGCRGDASDVHSGMSCSNLDHYADFPGSDLPQLLQARTGILPSVTVDPEYFLSNFK